MTVTELSDVASTSDFDALAKRVRDSRKYPGDPNAFGLALATVHVPSGTIIEYRFIQTNVQENFGTAALAWLAMVSSSDEDLVEGEIDKKRLGELVTAFKPYESEITKDPSKHLNIQAFDKLLARSRFMPKQGKPSEYRYAVVLVRVGDFNKAPQNAGEVYLPLYLLSQCKAEVNSINLDGAFGLLPNVLYTNKGPVIEIDAWDLFVEDYGIPGGLDKFPSLLSHVVPKGVRVNGAARLGARLDPGTTIMHAGFANFNAGTSGVIEGDERLGVMIEGRISQGVIIKDGADSGGGSSTMGTLSGGGKERVEIGFRSLVGANAGVGIKLGDDCIIEAGTYVTDGKKVLHGGELVHAHELNGVPNLKFVTDSTDGQLKALPVDPRKKPTLNAALHTN